jgi:dolichyl-phosphate-mannose-protein mannosyltransferase/tetratricopeptide repeat protein
MYINLNIPHRGILILSLAIPGILAAFTHLWNPTGFPNGPSNDEGIYIRRAMHVLSGQGPQESLLYDHPYFSQLFFASVLSLIGYPNSLNPSVGDVHSIETLYLVPRILMGMLAVADTFLIYKISERRYNRNVAFIASVLFAVMPLTAWLLRRVWLEPIQLPFLLTSILFAVYASNPKTKKSNIENNNNKKIPLVLLSGIFLGLAIFTKIPAVTMIPLVGFLIYQNNNNNRNLKSLGLWFIPVILIPLIWPTYAIYRGEFDLWLDGILWQTHRGVQTLFSSLKYDFKLDPFLVLLGIAGLVFIAIKRDLFLLLWAIPFLIFLYLIGFVSQWHFIPIIPAACIAAARLLEYLLNKIINKKKIHQVLVPFIIISGIAIFGLTSTIMIIATSDNSSYFEAAAFVVRYLHDDNNRSSDNNNKITVISNPFYSWIPLDVFHLNHVHYVDYYNDKIPLKTTNILLTVDPAMIDRLSHHQAAKPIQEIYNSNSTKRIAAFGGKMHNKYEQVAFYLYDNSVTVLNNKGSALAKLEMYNQSIVFFDKALAINPNNTAALNNKGLALAKLGKYNESVALYDKALSIDPNYVYALNNKNSALEALSKIK